MTGTWRAFLYLALWQIPPSACCAGKSEQGGGELGNWLSGSALFPEHGSPPSALCPGCRRELRAKGLSEFQYRTPSSSRRRKEMKES